LMGLAASLRPLAPFPRGSRGAAGTSWLGAPFPAPLTGPAASLRPLAPDTATLKGREWLLHADQ
ncbi:hypothetical protein, partial [Streptomyces tauricus]